MTQTCNPENAGETDSPDLASLLPVELFKALGDPSRVAILASLAMGGRTQTVSEVAARCPINISVVSRHLKTLKQVGILDSEKRGKEVLYHARIPYLVGLLRQLATALETCCPEDAGNVRPDDEE